MQVNVNEPIQNPKLVAKMEIFLQDRNQDTWSNMVGEMMDSHFLMPAVFSNLPETGEDGKLTLTENTNMQFPTLSTEEKQQYLMAFTDWTEVSKWNKEEKQQTIILNFDDYAAFILKNDSNLAGFVINPFHENVLFDREKVQSLKEQKEIKEAGKTEHIIKAGDSISYGQPRIYPEELVAHIRQHLKKAKEVKAAYLQLMCKNEEESWLLLLDFIGDKKVIYEEIAKAARPYLHGKFLDIVSVQEAFGLEAIQNIEPFYKKMFYKKPILKLPAKAIIEDTFAMKNGPACVLGCALIRGEFQINDQINIYDHDHTLLFHCCIDGIEKPGKGPIKKVAYDVQEGSDNRGTFLIQGHGKEDFKAGYMIENT